MDFVFCCPDGDFFQFFVDLWGPIQTRAYKFHTANCLLETHVLMYGSGMRTLFALISLFVSGCLNNDKVETMCVRACVCESECVGSLLKMNSKCPRYPKYSIDKQSSQVS